MQVTGLLDISIKSVCEIPKIMNTVTVVIELIEFITSKEYIITIFKNF
jgi:hypothetical protein